MTVLPAKVTLTDANGNPIVLQAGAAGLYIVDPNSVADGNRYTTLEAAAAAAKAAGPGTELLIAGDVTGAGVPIDITGVKVRGLGVNAPTITLPDGCTFVDTHNDFFFENVGLTFTGSHPVFTVGADGMAITLGQYATMYANGSSTNGMISIPQGTLFLNCFYANTLRGSSGHPLGKLAGTGQVNLYFGDVGTLYSNTFTGGASGAFTCLGAQSAAASIDQSQTGLTAPSFI